MYILGIILTSLTLIWILGLITTFLDLKEDRKYAKIYEIKAKSWFHIILVSIFWFIFRFKKSLRG